MKINKTKLFISLGAAASLALAGTAIACSTGGSGNGGRYDTNNVTSVKFATSFSANGTQQKAIKALIEKYNDTQANVEGYLKVEEINLPGGYGSAEQNVMSKITAKDKTTLYNLILNYPSLTSKLAQYNMNEPLDTDGSLMQGYEQSFVTNNIGGTDPKVTNVIPFGSSTVVSGVNGPVMSYLIRKAVEAGATLNSADEAWFKSEFTEKADFLKDDDFIEKGQKGLKGGGWGKVDDAKKSTWSGYTIKKSMFENFRELFDFGVKVFDSFSGLQDVASNIDNGRALVGIDSFFNFLTSYSYTDAGGSDGYLLDTEGNKNNFINYKNMFGEGKDGKNAKQYTWLKSLFEEVLSPGIGRGIIWMGAGGEYGSGYLKSHGMGISLGSTAGYNQNFVSEGLKNRIIDIGGEKTFIVDASDVLEVKKASGSGDVKDNAITGLAVGSFTNNLYISTVTTLPENKYFIQSKDAATDAKLTELKDKLTGGFFVMKPVDQKEAYEKQFGTGIVYVGTVNDQATNDKGDKALFFFAKEKIKEEVSADNKTLQKNELLTLQAPKKMKSTDTKAIVYLQGPQLLAIHSNDIGDKATKLFVQWLTSSDQKYDWKVGKRDYPQKTPQEFFYEAASYIVPYKGFTSDDSVIAKSMAGTRTNDYQKVTFNAFKEALKSDSDELVIFAESVDSSTAKLRESFEATLASSKTANRTNPNLGSFETFLNNLKTTFGKDNVR
ncbi:P68 family surface lipoprotein [Mycoplasmopsis agassizii]|uniref:P68 family surface lipoprotein n=1 Tax=Mycoplasmopsis agassizii TaxID=33922 RepID=UPI003528BFDA